MDGYRRDGRQQNITREKLAYKKHPSKHAHLLQIFYLNKIYPNEKKNNKIIIK
jgi:hypothetical protein